MITDKGIGYVKVKKLVTEWEGQLPATEHRGHSIQGDDELTRDCGRPKWSQEQMQSWCKTRMKEYILSEPPT